MKKVIAAAAGLLMIGAMVSVSYGEVTLGGDARVRYVYKDDYDFGNSQQGAFDYFDSRVRVTLEGKAKGGAFVKVRMRFDDFRWDGQGWNAYQDGKNVWADYAWIGVPMGPVTVEGGRMVANFTKFFSWDNRPTRLKAGYKNGPLSLTALVDVKQEDADNFLDNWDDNDYMAGGLVGSYRLSDDWLLKGYARYEWDDREWMYVNNTLVRRTDDNSGFLGSLHLAGKAAGFGLETEVAYRAAGVIAYGKEDDGWGWYGNGDYTFGSITTALNIGITRDGYLADNDFGWIMLGNTQENPTAVISQIGTSGDWTWIAPTVTWAATDRFTLVGNFVWVNVDGPDEADISDNRLAKLYEISGAAHYVISEGAEFAVKMGYLQPDFDGRLDGIGVQDDGAFGGFGRLQIKF